MGVAGVRSIMPSRFVTVVETTLFQRQAATIWGDEEREHFIAFIALHPEDGDVIPNTGGIRKVRWARAGSGKRGGVRVIYYYHHPDRPLYLLMVYTKARRENLTSDEKREVRRLAAILKNE